MAGGEKCFILFIFFLLPSTKWLLVFPGVHTKCFNQTKKKKSFEEKGVQRGLYLKLRLNINRYSTVL